MSYIEEKHVDLDGQKLTKKTWNNGDVWYINGQSKLHRLDGPAYIGPNGTEEEYWINDKEVTKREVDLLWLKKQVQ